MSLEKISKLLADHNLSKALTARDTMVHNRLAQMLQDRQQLHEGRSWCLTCYGMQHRAAWEKFAEHVQSLLEDGLVAVLDDKRPGVLRVMKGTFKLPTAEKVCRDHGWFPVSHLMDAWMKSEAVIALRQTHPDIDLAAEDSWGPESGLKFWNAPAGDYSHALTWEALYIDNGYTEKIQESPI